MNIRFILVAFLTILFPHLGYAMTPEETTLVSNAAERGSDGAQLLIAIEYLHGNGVQKDEKRAAYWLERAGMQGNAAAQQILGDLYEQGRGVPKNLKLSADWRKKAADRGNTDAQLELGKMYLSGEGVEKNAEQAEYWLKRAAVEGSAEAQFLLGKMYKLRSADRREQELAENFLARSAEEGYESAVEFMQFMEDTGYEVAEVFHQHPINLQKLAEDGDASSQYKLATRYESGHGEKLDYEKALYWFRKAAANGNVMAMKSLAHIYEKGLDGVVADPKAAAFWAEKARTAPAPD
ncbi:MAG: tetratricopeptide repeat protein [Sulfuricella sp.]